MKTTSRKFNARVALLLGPLVAAGCMSIPATNAPPTTGNPAGGGGGTLAGSTLDQAAGPHAEGQTTQQLKQDITLHIDPTTGTISPVGSRATLAVIASQLALDFDAVNLIQNGANTNFVLAIKNRGSAVVDLSMAFGGDRQIISPTNRVSLGGLAGGSDAQQAVSCANPTGGAFNLTVSLWAQLQAAGDVSTTGSTPAPSQTPLGTPIPAPSATPASTGGATPTPVPTANATATPTTATPPPATPTPAPVATATPTPVATSTPAPGATATPVPMPTANTTPPPPVIANPGPNAIAGRILMNGSAPFRSSTLTLVLTQNGAWQSSQTITSDTQGNYSAANLAAGDYLVYYYNDSHRDEIGYWKSRTLHVDATTGAAFPVIDFYQVGLKNVPAMDTHVTLPTNFQWIAQTQTVGFYHWRLHSTSGRTFTLIYQSDKLDGSLSSFSWNGAGVTLDPTNRYFWGVSWDAGAAGEGGNLYQAVYFNH
jgi:hypothetical protein